LAYGLKVPAKLVLIVRRRGAPVQGVWLGVKQSRCRVVVRSGRCDRLEPLPAKRDMCARLRRISHHPRHGGPRRHATSARDQGACSRAVRLQAGGSGSLQVIDADDFYVTRARELHDRQPVPQRVRPEDRHSVVGHDHRSDRTHRVQPVAADPVLE